jgi:hypothetical protein
MHYLGEDEEGARSVAETESYHLYEGQNNGKDV